MSLYLDFEPHSYYKNFAIRNNREQGHDQRNLERKLANDDGFKWAGYTENGDSGHLVIRYADTLKELKTLITEYVDAEKARIARRYGKA